jgi:hypothetical protein
VGLEVGESLGFGFGTSTGLPSLIEGHGLIKPSFIEDCSVGCVVVLLAIKVVVVIIVGSLLVGNVGSLLVGGDSGESLEFEVGASLLKVGSLLVGDPDVGESLLKVGSLLVRDPDVGESLGLGVGASLLGSSVIGENVGLKVVGDILAGRSVIGDSVTGFKVGPPLGSSVSGFVVGMDVSCIESLAATTFMHHRRTFVPVKVAVISSSVPSVNITFSPLRIHPLLDVFGFALML